MDSETRAHSHTGEPCLTRLGGLGQMERIAAMVRLTLMLGWVAVLFPIFLLSLVTETSRGWFTRFFWKGMLRFANVKVQVHGQVIKHRPLLFVSNHLSYMDIAILGSVLPGSFVSKADVRGWPGIGPIAVLAGTIFIERKRSAAAEQKKVLSTRLERGMPLILFPEGTSNDGNRVLPFKSTLFSIAEREIKGKPVMVQPVSISYTKCRGVPIGYAWRHFYAWYGDMELAPHIWAMLHMGQLTVDVTLLEPQSLSQLGSRKNAALVCEKVVRESVSGYLSGRAEAIMPYSGDKT